MVKRLLLLLWIFSISSAANCLIDVPRSVVLSDVGLYLGVVFVLNVVVIALAYMIGESFHMPQLTVFAKEEIFHAVFSAVLLIAFGGILTFSCSVSDGFLGFAYQTINPAGSTCFNANSDSLKLANCYITKMEASAESVLKSFTQKSLEKQMDSTTMLSLTLPLVGGTSTGLYAYRKAYSMQYDMVVDAFVIPSLISIKLQKVFLTFIDQIALEFLLPIAFFFRIFFPTRQMGNLLLGIVLGVYVIFPMLYALNASMFDFVFPKCSDYSSIISDNVFGGCGVKGGSFWDVAKLLPQAFFLPNLAIALFITFSSGIGKALRGVG